MKFAKRHLVLVACATSMLFIAACAPAEPAPPPVEEPKPVEPAEPKPPEPVEPKPPEPAPPPEPEETDLQAHFEGAEIEIMVGFSPGGGYDVFARMLEQYVGEYLPGQPARITVQNLEGGGGLRGLQATMRAEPDGYTIGLLHPRFVQREIVDVEVPDFDLNTVLIIGSPTGGNRVPRIWCMEREIATSWEEVLALGRPVTDGGTAAGETFGMGPQFVEAIGGPIAKVFGYGGTSEIMAAFDRGELDSINRCTDEHVPRLFPEWIEQGRLAPIFWWEAEPPSEWLEELGVEEVPHLLDVVETTEVERDTFEAAVELASTDRIFVLPPGVDEEIHQAWVDAFEAAASDERFIESARDAGFELGLATSDDVASVVEMGQALPQEGKDLLAELVGD